MEVITLNKKLFSNKCKELVSKLDFTPNIIVGILNGGGYILEEVKHQNYFQSAIFYPILLQRKNIFKNNKFFKFFIGILPYSITNRLRIYESKKVNKALKSINLEELSNYVIDKKLDIKTEVFNGKILILDDSIDSGKTMFKVKHNIAQQYPDFEIKTAVISWTLENSIEKPDYFIFKNKLVRFPWSKDYK